MLLTTGNKSENGGRIRDALYGDMNGGFAPIKDCIKQLVYRLAHYRNALAAPGAPVIPARVIEREPSAELRPNQKDTGLAPALRGARIRSSRPSSRKTCPSMRSARAASSARWSRAS